MKFVALKPVRIVTLAGHAVSMKEGEEKDLHGLLAAEAMKTPNIVPVEHAEALLAATAARKAAEDEAEEEQAEADEAKKELADAKKTELEQAIVQLIGRNDPADFTTQGYPRVAAVMGILNREDISSAEIKEAFDGLGENSVG